MRTPRRSGRPADPAGKKKPVAWGAAERFQRSLALHRSGDLRAAEAGYREALAIDAAHFDALHMLGVCCYQQRRHAEALAWFERALAIDATVPGLYSNRGNALRSLGRPAEALESYDRALRLAPDFGEAWGNRGNALRDLQRPADALASYERALSLQPDSVETLNGCGLALRDLGRLEEALACHERALAVRPDHAGAAYNRGVVLKDLERDAEALEVFDALLARAPDHLDALRARGLALRALDRQQEALACYERVLAIVPDDADALNFRGNALKDLKRFDQARESFSRARALRPASPDIRFNEGLCCLEMGDLEPGWEGYESRWDVPSLGLVRQRFGSPPWRGETPLAGKTLLLHAEQGLGDTIQFCRYALLAQAQGARVVLGVQPALKTLLASLSETIPVVADGEPLPPFDCHAPLLSAPLAFRTRLDDIPAQVPYLFPSDAARGRWASRLADAPPPRIGLVWSGNPANKNDRRRSIPLASLDPVLASDARFFGVLKDLRESDRATLARYPQLHYLGDELSDFADTAGLLANLDLVIAVDTSVAHLAGALGRPVWLMVPYVPDWRWLHGREDSPWYPTLRIFRQPAPNDWDSVIRAVAAALQCFLATPRSA